MTHECNSCMRRFGDPPKAGCQRKYDHTDQERPRPEDCIDHRGDGCEGDVEYRMPLSGTGRSFPRCNKAWSERLDREEVTRERYGHPNSPFPPPGFDPAYAGESWSDD